MASTFEALRLLRTALSGLCAVLFFGSVSCTFGGAHHKKARVFVPPPVAARPIPSSQPPRLPPPRDDSVVAAAPAAEVDLGSTPTILPSLSPPPVAPPKRPVAAVPKAQPQPPQPVPVDPTPAAPQPGQIYTAEQAREYNRTIDDSLERVRRALQTVAGKNLSAQQTQIAESIRTFQRQAETMREQDLAVAVELARRADVLARDLIARLP